MHHTIGPDLDTIRAVLNSTFRRFGSPPFLSRSPPFATATFFIPGEWATDPMCVRARVCVCACHRKRDNPSRVSQKLPQREILPNGFDSTPPFSFFSGFSFFFFFYSLLFVSLSRKNQDRTRNFQRLSCSKISSSSGECTRLNVLRLVLIIIVRPCEDNCM